MKKGKLIFTALIFASLFFACKLYEVGNEAQPLPITLEDCLPDSSNQVVFKVVEEMPRFPGCEEIAGDANEKKLCADELMLDYVHENIDFYNASRINPGKGRVVVRFVVETNGCLSNISVVRDDVGGDAAEEAMRIVHLMNIESITWSSGKQRGIPRRVQYNLPIFFGEEN